MKPRCMARIVREKAAKSVSAATRSLSLGRTMPNPATVGSAS